MGEVAVAANREEIVIMKVKLIGMILGFALSTNSWATYSCSGPVGGLGIEPATGDVIVESLAGLAWPRLCSVSRSANGIDPQACKTVYSALLTAQTTGKSVNLWFDDDVSGGNCGTHPSWQFLEGWYFGPKLN